LCTTIKWSSLRRIVKKLTITIIDDIDYFSKIGVL
jgi:hypothetical protein